MTGTSVFSLLGKLAIDGVDETKKALDDVAKNGEDAKNKLNVSFQDIGNKAGEMGKKMTVGLAGVATAAIATVESTKEFRQDLGRLEAGFSSVGLSTETATNVFKTFYGILGEDDTAIEASNLLKELTQDEQGLAEWTDIAAGVYARFPDSIPIEAMIESANETLKVGQITGNLADAINWASASNKDWQTALGGNKEALGAFNGAIAEGLSAEEAFNAALAACNNETEREQLLRSTMNTLYGEASATYQDVNGSVIANNEAQAEMNLKMAETAEKLEPLITKGKLFLAEVLLKLQPLITWVIDNINILAPIILGFMGALFALNIASKIMALIPVITTLNAVLTANPIGAIIMAVVALIAIIVTLWNKCEWFRNFVIGLWNVLKKAFSIFVDAIKIYINLIISYFKFWINVFKTVVNGIKTGIENIKKFFANLKDNVVSKVNSLKESISNTFNKIKDNMAKPVEKARDIIKGIIDKIKGFFNFTFKLPSIKLPRFSIKPSGWKIGDLLKGSIPKLGIDWYAKAMNNPMLLDEPTAFGISSSGNIRVGGEAGSEIVGGANTIMGMISNAVSSNNGGMEDKLDRLISLLTNYLPALSNQQVVLSTGELVGALTSPLDKSLGQLADDRRRGR